MKASVPFVRSPFNYDRDSVSESSGLRCDDVSLTKQSFAEEVDINNIVRRFGLTGELPVGVRMPTYADFTGVSDFQSALNAIVSARESFETMPAHVRAEFHNDPARFVDFCSDPGNRDRAIKLGLIVPPPAPPGPSAAPAGVPGTPPATPVPTPPSSNA